MFWMEGQGLAICFSVIVILLLEKIKIQSYQISLISELEPTLTSEVSPPCACGF